MRPDRFEAMLRQAVPVDLQPALEKALAWRPRLVGWKYTLRGAAEATAGGRKPALYGYRRDYMEMAARDYGLRLVGEAAVLPENEDIATLINWADETGNHGVLGVCLGYPLGDVRVFVAYARGRGQTLEAMPARLVIGTTTYG